MGWGLDNVGDALEGAYKGGKKLVGEGIDQATNVAGATLDGVGWHSAADAVEDLGDGLASKLGSDVAEQRLGQTEEPKELIHGDAKAIQETVQHLRRFHAAFEDAHRGLSRLDSGHWTGKAGDAFREKFDSHPKQWLKAADASAQAANALDRYADTVTWAQNQAQEAIEWFRKGQKASKEALEEYNSAVNLYNGDVDAYNDLVAEGENPDKPPLKPGPFTDPGQADRQAAQDILDAAREQRDSAAYDAQRAVQAVAETAPAKPDFSSRLTHAMVDSMDANTVELEHVIGGMVRGGADMVRFARSVNPTDPYNITHPAEWFTSVNLAAAGLVSTAYHPERLPSALLGTGWGSDPSEAGGRLGFNVLTAILTDGAGTAATSGERTAIAAAKEGAETATERGALDAAEQGAARSADDAAGEARESVTRDPRGNARASNATTGNGDPIDMATGRMFLAQSDVLLPGSLPLAFTRRTDSAYRSGRWFGSAWSSTIDQRLEIDSEGVVFVGEDGLLLSYPHPVPGVPTLPTEGPRWPLDLQADGGYTVNDPLTGRTWDFITHGDRLALLHDLSDRNGNRIRFEYAEDGTPTGIVHNAGYHVRISTFGDRVSALHLARAGDHGTDTELVRYGYTDGCLTELINSSGQPLQFGYDQRGRITSWTDRNGSRYDYAYDERGRCIYESGVEGHLRYHFDYDGTDPESGLHVTTATNSLGHTTRYLINDKLQVVAETDPTGAVTRSEWDRYDRLLSRTDALGRTVTMAYDETGLPTVVTRPDGREMIATYTDLGLPKVLAAPDGATWRQRYDDRGNRTELTDPTGTTTRYAYDSQGRPTAVTDALGNTTRIRCDAAGLPIEVIDPLGSTTRYERDAFGRVVSINDPLGAKTHLTWTSEGRLARRLGPDGSTQSWTYDGEGNCLTHTDAAGGVTSYEYTHFDQLSARTAPDGVRYTFIHDTELQLRQVTNPQGLTWTYDYDPAGRLISETDFDGRVMTCTHDLAGQLTARTNALGQTIRYEHDVLGRVLAKSADGQTTSYEYDLAGRLVQAIGSDATLLYRRDRLGRIVSETCNGHSLTYVYDLLGRRTQRTTPTGATSTWAYDAAGRHTALVTAGRTLDFEYDAAGREIARHFGEMITLAHGWDANGRLTHQTLTGSAARTIQRRAYTYRLDGSLTAVDDHLSGHRAFDLDAAGRVTGVRAHGWTERYAYDDAGNQTDADWPTTHPGHEAVGPRTYIGTRITRAGSVRYEHDTQGRIVLRQKARLSRKPDTWRFTWDAEDRLTAVTTPDGQFWRYLYDPLGRRIAKQRLAADGTVVEQTHFTWDGATLAEQATTSAELHNPVTLTWDHDGMRPLAQTERITAAGAPQHEIDERFFAIVTDLVGTPSELVGESGDLVWRKRSTIWGTTTWPTNATAYTPLRFPGQYFDSESGLHYNFHRYYDPETARYATPDPLGLTAAPNASTYVRNPLTWTDPLGLSPCSGASRSAPDFVSDSSGATQDVRGMGRSDNEFVLSGHGGIHAGDGTYVTVPEGTSVAMYSEHGVTISDDLGNAIETGNPVPLEVYGPGEKVPDYTLFPPDDLNILGAPRNLTVTNPTYLADLLQANMGRVHWAACRSVM